MKKIRFFFFFVLLSFSFIPCVFAYDYEITKYHVDIEVEEDNSLKIKEEITADFNVLKHGIIRTIPLINHIERADGTTATTLAKISDLKLNAPYTTTKIDGVQEIVIGDSSKEFIGLNTYEIYYTYHLSGDTSKDYDELYFNIIGSEWDTTIDEISFTIKMPKEFDPSQIGFTSGRKGSTDNHLITYTTSSLTIDGAYDGTLNPGEGLTIRIELPEGYFTTSASIITWLSFILPLLFFLVTFLLWYYHGRDPKVVAPVEFYPPDQLNSLDIAFNYYGKATSKDVVSLLIYLANQGYLKITEKEQKVLFIQTHQISVIKLKDYEGQDERERLFMEGLFKSGDEVNLESLERSFSYTINDILDRTNTKANKSKIFANTTIYRFLCLLLMGFSIISFVGGIAFSYANFLDILSFILILIVYFVLIWAVFCHKIHWIGKIFMGFFILIHASMMLPNTFLGKIILSKPIYIVGSALVFLSLIGMMFFFHHLSKRTTYGSEILGRIQGFKNFLETAAKEQLETLVAQDPTYFFDILPYTYVLGVSDVWMDKFSTLLLTPPIWYDAASTFDMNAFRSFMNITYDQVETTFGSSSSTSSSTGGGISGGGSGGGGGSSW